MPVELINPEGLPKPEHYVQLSVATGTRTVVPVRAGRAGRAGQPVGAGDLAAQVEQAYSTWRPRWPRSVAGFDDVAKLTLYVVDWSTEQLAGLGEGVARVAQRLGVDRRCKPITLLGVAALGEPDLLMEVEAVAVLA